MKDGKERQKRSIEGVFFIADSFNSLLGGSFVMPINNIPLKK
jgi:hypothetical protein